MNITLKQLKYFEALTQHGHFGRAADASAVTQPALSVQIKELEETLGMVLFERSARHVRLTSFGEDFSVRVRDILRAVDELGDMARAAQEDMTGRLRIGIIPTIAPYLLPQLIRHLGEAYPDLEVRFRETLTSRLVQELQDGLLDVAIVALPLNEQGFEETELFYEDFLLVRPEAQSNDPAPTREELQSSKLLLLEEGHCFREQAVSFCNLQPASQRDGLDGSSLSTLVQMVGAGIGMTLIPAIAAPIEARAAPVSLTALADSQPGRTVGIVWRKTNPLSPRLKQFALDVQTVAQTLRKADSGKLHRR